MDLKLRKEWSEKRAALEEGRDVSAGAPYYGLPPWEQAEANVEAGTPTALERFIHENEPAGVEASAKFRRGLVAVIEEAVWNEGKCRAAAAALVSRLDVVHADPHYWAVWQIAHNYRGPYAGPTYTAELDALREVLREPAAAQTSPPDTSD